MSTPEKQKWRFFFAKRHSFGRIFSIHAGNRAIHAGFLDFSPQMWYIQGSQMFPVFTISFHHSKEVFVCCHIVSLRCVFWVGLSIRGGGNDSPRPASQRAAAFVLTAALLTGAAFPAFAGTYYIEEGDIVISAGTEAGTNKVEQTGKDTVDNDKAGSLTATGGYFGAGIGGGSAKAGQVTITGGTITATGEDGAGIGGGQGNMSSNAGNADIEISGGTITAAGGDLSAGIGGGTWGDANIKITGDAVIKNATGGAFGAGIGGGGGGNGDVTISGNAKIENAQGGFTGSGIGGGNGASGTVTIKDDSTVTATGGEAGTGIGGGYAGLGDVTIEGNTTVNATGGAGAAGIGSGVDSVNDAAGNGNKITIRSNETGTPTVNATGGESSIDEETEEKIPGGAGIGSGAGDAKADITLEGKVTITATAGKDNVAIGANGIEQEFSGLAEGSSITRYNSEGNNITLPTDPGYPVPAAPSSSGGGSADASVQELVFPGLVVTDKDGQRISYTSIRGNNVLSIRVGRFTASLRASLATLRQLRAEGIDTITFQTILCSTTLSVDELLAMGGEDAEAVLTHRLTASSLTVG